MSVPKTVKLNNGLELPTVGLGTYSESKKGDVEEAVKYAIDIGYRHFDSAWFYGNEDEVGRGIRAKIDSGVVKREDIFVTSKLWNNFHAKELVIPKLKESLQNFGLDYLDLYLIHWPLGFKEDSPLLPKENHKSHYSDVDYLDTWRGMEEALKLGLTKSIGISNFNAEQIDRVLKNSSIKPVVNQVECNPNINQKKLTAFCKERDIVIVGYSPLSAADDTLLLSNPKVVDIAKKHNKTPAQVILNYLVSDLPDI